MNINKSFTLIELLVVLAIIVILSGVLIVVIKPGELNKYRSIQYQEVRRPDIIFICYN